MDFVKTNKVKEYIRSKDKSMSSNFIEELNTLIEKEIEKACNRAKANSRKTVYDRDL